MTDYIGETGRRLVDRFRKNRLDVQYLNCFLVLHKKSDWKTSRSPCLNRDYQRKTSANAKRRDKFLSFKRSLLAGWIATFHSYQLKHARAILTRVRNISKHLQNGTRLQTTNSLFLRDTLKKAVTPKRW